MAEKKILVNDLTGDEIGEDDDAVQLIIKPRDSKKGQWVLDTTMKTAIGDGDVELLAKLGRHQGTAGRRGAKK